MIEENYPLSFCSEIRTFRLLYKEQQVERETRVTESVSRVGSAVFMAAFTTFAAGFSMTLSSLSSFQRMGQFLMTISMLTITEMNSLFALFTFSVYIMDICHILLSSIMCDYRSSG